MASGPHLQSGAAKVFVICDVRHQIYCKFAMASIQVNEIAGVEKERFGNEHLSQITKRYLWID
jgi:hypothetical protein